MSATHPITNLSPNQALLPIYEDSLKALIDKVEDVVFSKWGLGLGLLTVCAGACFGALAAATAFAIFTGAIILYAHTEWRISQLCAWSDISSAAKDGNSQRVQALLSRWESFLQVHPRVKIGELFTALKEAFNFKHMDIARMIIEKIFSEGSSKERLETTFAAAIREKNETAVKVFIELYNSHGCPFNMTIFDSAVLEESLDLIFHIIKTSSFLENFSANEKEIVKWIILTKNNQIAEKLEELYLDRHPNFWDMPSHSHLFQSACFKNRENTVRKMLSLKDSHPTLKELEEELINAIAEDKIMMIKCLLGSNIIKDGKIIKNCLNSTDAPEVQKILRDYALEQNITLSV